MAWKLIAIDNGKYQENKYATDDETIPYPKLENNEHPYLFENENEYDDDSANESTFQLTGCDNAKSEISNSFSKIDASTMPICLISPSISPKKAKIILPKLNSEKNSPKRSKSYLEHDKNFQIRIQKAISRQARSIFIEKERKKRSEELQKKIEEEDALFKQKQYENDEKKYSIACQKCIEREEKIKITKERRLLHENENKFKLFQKMKRENEVEQRSKARMKQKSDDLQWKAADRYVKQRIATQNAKQMERRKEAAALQKMRRAERMIALYEEKKAIKRREELEERLAIQKEIEKLKLE